MGHWSFGPLSTGLTVLAQAAADAARPEAGNRWDWVADPRTAVLFVLASIVIVGGGRRLLQGMKARQAVDRLADPDVSPREVLDAAEFGRAGILDLFRLLAEGKAPEIRDAAGKALAIVWKADDLITEEEKAVVTRGLDVRWIARRRYPRGLTRPFSVGVRCALPFLDDEGRGIAPGQLEWSYRVLGSRRASLETFSDWAAGPVEATVPVEPGDFPDNGPHRLVFQAKVRPSGLTSTWELELPHVPFTFEFDPNLRVDAILGSLDDVRAEAFAAAVSAVRTGSEDESGVKPGSILAMGPDLAIRNPPLIRVLLPIPNDLAHRVALEIEGVPGRLIDPSPLVVLSRPGQENVGVESHPVAPPELDGISGTDCIGPRKMRAVLSPDPELAWSHPEVRSLWPGELVTDWCETWVIRR